MLKRVLSRRRPSEGQSLPLFAIMMPAALALLGLGLDGARAYTASQQAQGVADLVALSAARELPDKPLLAHWRALELSYANGFPLTQLSIVSPYDGDPNLVEITVTNDVPTTLLSVLGVLAPGDYSTLPVTARAVARGQTATASGGEYAVYALEDSCGASEADKSIDWSGSDVDITGLVHSESGILVGGSYDSVTGGISYECSGLFDGGSGNTYAPAPVKETKVPPFELAFDALNKSGVCDFYGPRDDTWDLSDDGAWWHGGTKNSGSLRDGVYCTKASGDKATIKLSESDVSGNVTFAAGYSVEISGSDFDLRPYHDGVLMYSNGNTDVALKLSGSNGDWEGIPYAPRGRAEISGSSNWSLIGGVVAESVKLNGSNFGLTGTLLPAAESPAEQALVE